MRYANFLAMGLLAALTACGTPTPNPDYSIKVVPNAEGTGYAAIPPNCPRWADNDINFFDNQPLPQFGCADARNMALMAERPQDMLEGRNESPASGVTAAGAVMRYENNQTRGLIYPSGQLTDSVDATTAPAAASGMTGETPLASPSPAGK